MRPRTGVCALTLVGLFALSVFAREQQQQTSGQPPSDQSQQPPKPIFRTGAELVRVDAVVLDRNGRPVTSLTQADFELQEGGVTQEIRSFQYVEADGQPDADDELSLTIRSRSHAAMEAAKDNVRLFLIFWDEYHIGQMMSANRARSSLAQFVRTAFGPTDIVGFMDPLTPIDAIQFTRDRLELFERTRRLIGRSGVYVPTRSAVEDAQLQRGDVERLRSEVTVSALKSAVVHLGGLRDGRKSIILISEGLRGMMRDGQSVMTDLIRAANDNNTAIYVLDPRGFGTQRFPSMFEPVSADTGGQYFRSNDLLQAMKQVVTQSSGFYLLGYSPAPNPMDGKFHKIRVRVKPSGLDVRARSGYWAPSVSDMERARAKAADAVLPPDVQRALTELPSSTAHRSIDLWAGASLDPAGPTVRVSWVPRAGAPAQPKRTLNVAAVAARDSLIVFEGPIAAEGAAFRAIPGPLKLTVTVTDGAGELIDRDVKTIDVPDPSATALAIGAPAVFRAQNALELRTLDRSPTAIPFAGREFVRTDRLFMRFTVYGAGAATAKVTTRIISQWGKDLAELPVTRRAPDQNQYEIDLPLSSVARGDFLIAIGAEAGSESVRTFVPIRVLR
ncbi:MAG TPA: VWA domain-containing protein [Vicinamibacterales bacterium]